MLRNPIGDTDICYPCLICFTMAVYTVFRECIRYEYKSTLCSKATLFMSLVFIFTVISPLLIAYRSNGFWIKIDKYREQPDVHFKHEYLLIVETNKLENSVICTTYGYFSQIMKDHNHCTMVKSREEDTNRDGKYDELYFEIQVNLPQNQVPHAVTLFLIFDYRLYKMSSFQMESLGVIQHSSSLPGTRFDVMADLRLTQKQLLHNHRRDVRFNKSVLNMENIFIESFSLHTLLKDYARRNVSTILMNMYTLWTTGRPTDEPFFVSAIIHYPEETISYKPGFWQIMKCAWMQYVSVLVIFVWVLRTVKSFVFQNQLVTSIKCTPWKKDY